MLARGWIIFILLNLLLSGWFLNNTPTSNPTARALPIVSYLETGHLYFDKYANLPIDKALINGHYYTDKAPLTTFLVLPFAWVGGKFDLISRTGGLQPLKKIIALGSFICGTLPFVLILAILFVALRNHVDTRTSALESMLIAYGSNLFIFSGSYWGHLLAGALSVLGYYLLFQKSKPAWAGLVLSMSVSAEYPTLPLIPLFCIADYYKTRDFKRCLTFCSSALPVGVLIGLYHYAYTGSPFRPLYAYVIAPEFAPMKHHMGFSMVNVEVLWELIFGAYRGLFFYSPILLYFAWIVIRNYPSEPLKEKLFSPAVLTCIYFLLMNASYFVWWGGWSHGPRHLTPALCILLYALCYYYGQYLNLKLVVVIGTVGILLNWMAKSVYSIYPDKYRLPYSGYVLRRFWDQHFDNATLVNEAFGVNKTSTVLIWPVLMITIMILIYRYFNRYSNSLRGREGKIAAPGSLR